MRCLCLVLSISLYAAAFSELAGQEPEGERPAAPTPQLTLLGEISKWQYPKSQLQNSEMSDVFTGDKNGRRTTASISLKTTMTTTDSVEKVVEFYKKKINVKANVVAIPLHGVKQEVQAKKPTGMAVMIHDDSKGRPFEMQTIAVVTADTSTTIVVTRGKGENKTYISWKQYRRM